MLAAHHRLLRAALCAFAAACSLLVAPALAAAGGASFTVTLDKALVKIPVSGRLVVSIIGPGAKVARNAQPNEAPFWDDPQPMYAIDVKGLAPGASVTVDDGADCFLTKPSVLPPGRYKAQARLIRARTDSDWSRTPGNLFSASVAAFEVTSGGKPATVALTLDTSTSAPTRTPVQGVEWVEVPSTILSEFHGRAVTLRAAVVIPAGARSLPQGHGRAFPAVYEVTGFGGSAWDSAVAFARQRPAGAEAAAAALAAHAFWIVLDAESPNGHTLFADSDNNGPCGRALVEELIPALEARYPLIAKPSARLLRGHSSGGWSTLWLALNYPDTFGGCWSSSPDPVDFRRFQTIDIYADANAFSDKNGKPRASYRRAGKTLMTVQQEIAGEQLLGPAYTSGQQWSSWMAAFGARTKDGLPAPLIDPVTGAIDAKVAATYRKYDLNLLLRAAPDKHLPAFRDRIRLVCGGADNFFLNEAVTLLQDTIAELTRDKDGFKDKAAWTGYIKMIPTADHGTIFGSPAVRAIPTEMAAELRKHGHMPALP